jgi:hypothetical protein
VRRRPQAVRHRRAAANPLPPHLQAVVQRLLLAAAVAVAVAPALPLAAGAAAAGAPEGRGGAAAVAVDDGLELGEGVIAPGAEGRAQRGSIKSSRSGRIQPWCTHQARAARAGGRQERARGMLLTAGARPLGLRTRRSTCKSGRRRGWRASPRSRGDLVARSLHCCRRPRASLPRGPDLTSSMQLPRLPLPPPLRPAACADSCEPAPRAIGGDAHDESSSAAGARDTARRGQDTPIVKRYLYIRYAWAGVLCLLFSKGALAAWSATHPSHLFQKDIQRIPACSNAKQRAAPALRSPGCAQSS